MKLIVILLILFGSSWAVNDPKLSAEGINKDKSERKFRSGKVHQLWKKANEVKYIKAFHCTNTEIVNFAMQKFNLQ